jgi:N-acetylneuraminate lyase
MHLKGLIAAVVTPFDKNGNINPTIISKYTKFLKTQGVAGVLVNGTTGEGFSLTNDERKTMASAWAAEKTNNFKIIIHIGHTSQKSSIKLAEHADTLEVNGIAEIGPIFFKPTKVSELVSYCINTAASTSLPYYYYHIPSMNGLDFNMFEFLGKADKKIKNLTGIKYTHHNIMDYSKCKNFENNKYDIIFGRDELLLEALAKGAKGAIGSTYNIFPQKYLKLMTAFSRGSLTEANEIQSLCRKIIDILYAKSFFSALRHVLRLQGLETGEARAPIPGLSTSSKSQLAKELKNIQVL